MDHLFYFANVNNQSLDIRLSDKNLDDGYMLITMDDHARLFKALNNQCIFFSNLTISEPRPSQWHTWDNVTQTWQDHRTDEEKYQSFLATLVPLSRRRFKLMLLDHDLLSRLDQEIAKIADVKKRARIEIEYQESTEFKRTSDAVAYLFSLLGLKDQEIDEMWQAAMKI